MIKALWAKANYTRTSPQWRWGLNLLTNNKLLPVEWQMHFFSYLKWTESCFLFVFPTPQAPVPHNYNHLCVNRCVCEGVCIISSLIPDQNNDLSRWFKQHETELPGHTLSRAKHTPLCCENIFVIRLPRTVWVCLIWQMCVFVCDSACICTILLSNCTHSVF